MRKIKPPQERFWDKVHKTESCWLWTGALLNKGHGVVGRGGRYGGSLLVHRLSYEMHVGPIPAGLFVCHHCDVRHCVNPAHLFVGTQTDNMRDCASKGRVKSPFAGITHCKRGHEFTADNIIWIKIPRTGERRGRMCKRCTRERPRKKPTQYSQGGALALDGIDRAIMRGGNLT